MKPFTHSQKRLAPADTLLSDTLDPSSSYARISSNKKQKLHHDSIPLLPPSPSVHETLVASTSPASDALSLQQDESLVLSAQETTPLSLSSSAAISYPNPTTVIRPSTLSIITPQQSMLSLCSSSGSTSSLEQLEPRLSPTHLLSLPLSPSFSEGESESDCETKKPTIAVATSAPSVVDLPPQRKTATPRGLYWVLLLVALLGWNSASLLSGLVWGSTLETGPHSVYIAGGGFSGYWFTLGRLSSLPDPLEKDYYCYSAGCLAIAAVLENYTVDEMYHQASDVQQQWQRGDLSRHQVVPAFLNHILKRDEHVNHNSTTTSSSSSIWNNPEVLSKLHILTTTRSGSSTFGWGVQVAVTQPTSLEHLYTLLLQTTWIPFAVGQDLWHQGHMDGAFSVWQHPKCAQSVHLALDWGLLSNAVNVNLGPDQVRQFWDLGIQYGLA